MLSKSSLEIDIKEFENFVSYDPNVESCLKLIKPWSFHFNFKIKPGEAVGSKQYMRGGVPHGYRFRFKGRNYLVHRVIYAILNGGLSTEYVIDHLDGNPFNNKIENIRAVLPEINTRNAHIRVDNKTGHSGIRLMFNGCNSYYVQAVYKKNLKAVSKRWSLSEYNYQDALQMAISWRELCLKELDNGYTERHGKPYNLVGNAVL